MTRAERLGLEPGSIDRNTASDEAWRIEAGKRPRPPGESEVQLSIAISLRRIADAVCGDDQNTGIHCAILEIASGNQL